MAGSELLIRHAAKWAEKRSAPFDADLLETALELRSFHDGLAANRWPEGSVEHLMLERWPAHGPSGVPDPAALVATLESFWKFLSNTGRMARGSADPRALRAEARRAESEMAAAAADTGRHSQSKVLTDFGREIGISLDEAESIEDLQEKLDRITQAWNNLPQEERFRRSPALPSQGSRMGRSLTDAANAMMARGELPEGWDLPGEPPLAEDEDLPDFSDPALSGPHWLASPYCRSLDAFAHWVGEGREVTATGQLRPAVAREAYRELDLWAWEKGWEELNWGPSPNQVLEDMRREAAVSRWRSAGDSLGLSRLWYPMVASGLVEVRSKRAVARRHVPTQPPIVAVQFGLMALAHLAIGLRDSIDPGCLMGILFGLSGQGGERRSRAELAETWWASPLNPLSGLRDHDDPWLRGLSDRTLGRCLAMFGDCGLWVEDRGALVGTEFGWDLALILALAIDHGVLEIDADV